MKKKILSIVLFFILSTKAAAHTEHYKDLNVLEYELFRNNNSIGFHNYKFERNKNYSSVKSRIAFKINNTFYIQIIFTPFEFIVVETDRFIISK